MLLVNVIVADVTTLLPYVAEVKYDSSSNKSAKDESIVSGIYASKGDFSYLFEVGYSYMDTLYKDSTVNNLIQHDISMVYSKYNEKYMLKAGIHHIVTNDTDLGDGDVLIAAIGGYQFVDYDKYNYGVEGYYSFYKDAHNENYDKNSISIIQLTPYFSFFKTINTDNKNSFDLKLNYIMVDNYIDKEYLSFEISDTYYYRKFIATIQAHFGEMRTGVKDSGMTVFNTMDLLKNGYSLKLGYYIKDNLILKVSYGLSNYEEYGKTEDGTSHTSLISLSYSF